MIAVEIKKFVVIVLAVSISLLIPLQALAQIEPQITYGEWCAHLAELHAEREAVEREMVRAARVAVFWIAAGPAAMLAGVAFLSWASILAGCALCVLGIAYSYSIRADNYGVRPLADVQREIELWEQAGTARMWFYPCK